MKYFILFFGLSLSVFYPCLAQTSFSVPQQVRMSTAEDYKRYHKDIIAAAKWLQETPMDRETEKRKAVNAFVMQWITGTDQVSLGVNSKLGEIMQENPELFAVYAAVYSRHILEQKGAGKEQDAIRAGLLAIINIYNKGAGVKKSKTMAELARLAELKKLDDYIKHDFHQ